MTARELARQGAEAFERGEYEVSLALTQRAYELVRVPTISIYVARSLQGLGRSASGERVDAEVDLQEGQSHELALTLAPTEPTPPDEARGPQSHAEWGPQRTLAWVGLGVGAIGLGAGVVTGLLAVGDHTEAQRLCPEFQCIRGSAGEQAANRFHSMSTISSASYVIGAVGLTAGAILLLTAPKSHSKPHAGWTPYLGPSSAGLAGSF